MSPSYTRHDRPRVLCVDPRLLEEGRSRLTLTLKMRGLLVPVVGLFYTGLPDRYMAIEAEGMKRAAESAAT